MSGTDGLDGGRAQAIEEFLDRWMVREDVPGASVAVVDRDGLLYANGLGARNVAKRSPATAETLYPFASVTKAVTAIAVGTLVDRGELAFDDAIEPYTDYWAEVPGDPITVGDLLAHSSGMPGDSHFHRLHMFSDDPPSSPIVTAEDRIRHVNGAADRRILDEDRFMYNDLGFAIAGLVVEAVDGRAFEAFVADEIFEPLGMDRSRIGYGDHAEADEDAAQGYVTGEGDPEPTEFDLAAVGVGDPQAAGGLLTSVREMTRLVRCVMNGGTLEGTRLLGEDTVERMCSHQAPRRWSIDGDARGYGYGWLIDDSPAERVVGHGGTTPGVSQAYAGFLPDRGLGTALAFNTTGIPKQEIGRGVLAIAAGNEPAEFVPALALREKVRAVTGTYEGFRGFETATVDTEGSTVTITFDGGDPDVRAFPESTDRDDYSFYTVDHHVRTPVTFHETDSGMELRIGSRRLLRTPN